VTYEITVAGKKHLLQLTPAEKPGEWICKLQAQPKDSAPREIRLSAAFSGAETLSLIVETNGRSQSYEARWDGASRLTLNGESYEFRVEDPRSLRSRRAAAGADEGPRKLLAPMPGKVVRVLAPAGTEVEAGQGVLVVEAMKMQNELKSPKKGRVSKVLAAEGAAVNAGDALAIVE
jgi:biotin carboxyl carrier protein